MTHAPWFRDLFGSFDGDTRSIATSNGYPWRAIGVVYDERLEMECTGFLVSRSRVVTSAHCVLDDANRASGAAFYSVVRHTHHGTLDYPAEDLHSPRAGLSVSAGGAQGRPSAETDIAWFDVSPGIGGQLGFLGVEVGGVRRSGQAGAMTGPAPGAAQEACRGTLTEPPWRRDASGTQGGPAGGDRWTASDPRHPPGICVAGYSGDLGFTRLAVADGCGVLALVGGLVLHTCHIEGGASGGPLFYLDRDGNPVVFAVSAGETALPDLQERLGIARLFVGVLLDLRIVEAR